jgi:intein/homing endonuclease
LSFSESIASIKEEKIKLQIKEDLEIKKALQSNDVDTLFKAQQLITSEKSDPGNVKSILVDPNDLMVNMGYRDKPYSLTYEMLRGMGRIHVIKSIVETRKEQVASFCQVQKDKYSTGFVIKKRSLLPGSKPVKMSKQDEKKIEMITEFLLFCGNKNRLWKADTFDTFTRKVIQDSLILDQATFEVVRNKKGELDEMLAVDAATMRIADSYDDEEYKGKERVMKNNCYPNSVQIIDTIPRAEYYPWELCFGIRNPTTDIHKNGYGRSELEDMVLTVTSILQTDQYNSNFFKVGASPKGILSYSGNINENSLQDFRRQWMAQTSGVMNCLHGDSRIITKENGLVSLSSFFTEDEFDKFVSIWTGDHFEEGRVVKTDLKQVYKLKTNNGLTVKSSPEHRFKILSDKGEPIWVERKNLKVGDYVLVNKETVSNDEILYYNGIELKEDIFEILGWLLGDGCISKGNVYGKSWNKQIALYYHSTKEQEILKQHLSVLHKYGINAYYDELVYTEKQKQDLRNRNGFKNIADKRTQIILQESSFYDFLINFGFKTSKEKKNIPSKIFTLKSSLKCALLKGLFSADGCNSSKRSPQLSIRNKPLRKEVIQLLISEGIRVSACEGYFSKGSIGNSYEGIICIKDRSLFFEKISFIQDYKNQNKKPKGGNYGTPKSLSKELTIYFASKVRSKDNEFKILNLQERNELVGFCNPNSKTNCTLEKMISFFEKVQLELPNWVNSYYAEQVIELTETDEFVEMFDVEIFNEEHQFIVNGVQTHNSHKVPIINADKLNFIPTHVPNSDMEFSKYQEFLIKISCALYKIDPSEIGFPMSGNANGTSGLGGDSTAEKLKYSKDKGLKPLLKQYQYWLNKYIVWQIDPDFELEFQGIDGEQTFQEELDNDIKSINAFMTINEIREKRGMKKVSWGDICCNPIAYQNYSMQQQQQMQEDQQGQGDEEENPFLKSLNLDEIFNN